MSIFRRTRRPSRPHAILAAAALEDAMARLPAPEMPPRPPQHRAPDRAPEEYPWASAFRSTALDAASDPCGAGPIAPGREP